MDIGSLFFLLITLGAVILVISRPFFKKPSTPEVTIEGSAIENYQREYRQVIKRMRELDFEATLGKISNEDQHLLTEEFKQRAGLLLENIEKTRQIQKTAGETLINPQMENLITDRRMQRRERSAGFCANCGKTLQKSDRFCPKCGAKIVS